MEVTAAYIVDEPIGRKSMTRRPTKIIPMMTKAVAQNQEKIFTKRECTGNRSRKRNTPDVKFISAFFGGQFRYSVWIRGNMGAQSLFLGPRIKISGPANA